MGCQAPPPAATGRRMGEAGLNIVLGTDRKRTEEVTRNISRGGMLIETQRDLARARIDLNLAIATLRQRLGLLPE